MPSISPQNVHQSSLVPYQNFEETPSQLSTFLTRFGIDSSSVQKVEVAARILQNPLTAIAICLVLRKVYEIYSGCRHQHLLHTDPAYKELYLSDAEYQQLIDNTPIDNTAAMTQNEAWGFLVGGNALYQRTHRAEEAYRQLVAGHPI